MSRSFASKALFAAALSLGGLSASADVVQKGNPVYLLLDNGMDLDGKGLTTSVYVNTTWKINSRFSVTPEMLNDILWRQDYQTWKDRAAVTNHKYLRIVVSDGSLAKIGSWKLGMAYRYRVPTTSADTDAGSFGQFMVRPALSRDFGPVKFMTRLPLSINLHTKKTKRTVAENAADGNTLNGVVWEFALGYAPTDFLSLDYFGYVAAAYQMKGASKKANWDNRVQEHELAIAYTKPVLGLDSIALVPTYAGTFLTGKAVQKTSRDNWSMVLRLEKTFNK